MSNVLKLKAECSACGSDSDLYGSNCKHITLCFKCGKSMAEKKEKCCFCGTIITRLIREYNVRRDSSANDSKSYFIGKFSDGHRPDFNNGFNWSLHKDPKHQGIMLKKAPWVLEDETGKIKYQGRREEPEFSKYYFLIFQNQEFVAVPADYWVNFKKVPGSSSSSSSNQLTLEEAETMMKDRKKFTAECRRRMMRAENSGVTGLDVEDNDEEEGLLSQSGKDMKALLVAANKWFNESDGMKLDDFADERITWVKKETRISVTKSKATTTTMQVTEEEVRAALLEMGPATAKDLSSRFKTRVVTKQDLKAFASIVKKIADVHKNIGSKEYMVLKRKRDSP